MSGEPKALDLKSSQASNTFKSKGYPSGQSHHAPLGAVADIDLSPHELGLFQLQGETTLDGAKSSD